VTCSNWVGTKRGEVPISDAGLCTANYEHTRSAAKPVLDPCSGEEHHDFHRSVLYFLFPHSGQLFLNERREDGEMNLERCSEVLLGQRVFVDSSDLPQ